MCRPPPCALLFSSTGLKEAAVGKSAGEYDGSQENEKPDIKTNSVGGEGVQTNQNTVTAFTERGQGMCLARARERARQPRGNPTLRSGWQQQCVICGGGGGAGHVTSRRPGSCFPPPSPRMPVSILKCKYCTPWPHPLATPPVRLQQAKGTGPGNAPSPRHGSVKVRSAPDGTPTGGATTTGPDVTHPPTMFQNSGGGGGGAGGGVAYKDPARPPPPWALLGEWKRQRQ